MIALVQVAGAQMGFQSFLSIKALNDSIPHKRLKTGHSETFHEKCMNMVQIKDGIETE